MQDTYIDRVGQIQGLSLKNAIEISRSLLPYRLSKAPWTVLGHGVHLLDTTEKMDAYMVAYGEMHMIKCRAALQNFPYDTLPFNVEIVDWGCGQGIATMTLMEMLRQRGLLDVIRKVTLVEPSAATLARAKANVRSSLYGRKTEVRTINKFLPASYPSHQAVASSDMPFTANATIHLFSNVLDITTISLIETARLLISSGRKHYVICTCPMNDNSGRVDDFCSLLNASNFFSEIASYSYSCTSDTHHPFGCKAKGFVLDDVTTATVNYDTKHNEYHFSGAYDDYDRRSLVRHGMLSEGFVNVYEQFARHLSVNDSIYIKPSMESDNPDLVIVRPYYGVLIVKMFEDGISGLTMKSKDIITRDDSGQDEQYIVSPIQTVLSYKKSLDDLYSSKIVEARVNDKRAYYVVKTAVCFPSLCEEMARAFCKSGYDELNKYQKDCCAILGNDSLVDNVWNKVGLNTRNSLFDFSFSSEIEAKLSSRWHSYTEGNTEIRLTKKQSEIARSVAGGRMKIRGLAGSGKTQVLASRAVNCHLRTGGKVLILTYNITLVNYIRSRLTLIPADFLWDDFCLGTYYRFFSSWAKNVGRRISIAESYENICFFDEVSDRLPKYDAILVDEAQDYKTEWLKILLKFFLKENGEFVVFGDANQNIYGRDALTTNTIPGVRGAWSQLTKCHRTDNNMLIDLALDFKSSFLSDVESDVVERVDSGELNYSKVRYRELGPTPSMTALYEECIKAISDFQADRDNTVILSATCEILRTLDDLCRQHGLQTETMCETAEQYDKVKMERQNNYREEIESIRENKKHHFTMDAKGLKMSTVHSFKGWQAETVILLIQPYYNAYTERTPYSVTVNEQNSEVLYTAITRSKKNLVIINLGNKTYGPFFRDRVDISL